MLSGFFLGEAMRRTDREVTDIGIIKDVLDHCQAVTYGLYDGKEPYSVPMSFGYEMTEDGKMRFYSHCAHEGRRLSILRNGHDRAAVSAFCDGKLYLDPVVVCRSGFSYRSFMGSGRLRIVEDAQEKAHGLKVVFKHYSGIEENFTEEMTEAVEVLCMELESFSCKICVK
ncbi:5-nitroimidazole antibiotic resistance protein [Parasutterella sp. NM82_D38]|jgi:Predicted flavin-nucleotide-binding protein|uniref:5-nitroimidazole antibiotic resistance protein n=2 Tax=Parasutterella muris TaxID=2565572 RepID=A0A6L6YN44_9BURK|nr:5-nitroimidazole antibiotic resistance protein [Parasutterella muris]